MDLFWLYAGFAVVILAALAGVALIILASKRKSQ